METVNIRTDSRNQFVDITSRVREVIARSGVQEGIAVVYTPHTTAALTINEAADPSVVSDILAKLAELVPIHDNYRHAEGNSDAHVKASLVGSSVHLIISKAAPVLGTWQGIFFCEFDGPRSRKALITVVPGK